VRNNVYVERLHCHGGRAGRSDEQASGRTEMGHDATRPWCSIIRSTGGLDEGNYSQQRSITLH
jgi:hypothetical protein